MNSHMRTAQAGFTLIELVVVIVILGILAAFAIPRFVDVNVDARRSAIEGLGGSMRSSSALAHGLALARGQTGSGGTNDSVTMEGQAIDLEFGYPEATLAGIGATLTTLDGFDTPTTGSDTGSGNCTAGAARPYIQFTNGAATAANCNVRYYQATAAIPSCVLITSTNCS